MVISCNRSLENALSIINRNGIIPSSINPFVLADILEDYLSGKLEDSEMTVEILGQRYELNRGLIYEFV